MDTYIGTKIIQAEPQEKDGMPGYKVVYEDGYVSWSPAGAFMRAYRKITMAEKALVEKDGQS